MEGKYHVFYRVESTLVGALLARKDWERSQGHFPELRACIFFLIYSNLGRGFHWLGKMMESV